MINKKFFGLVAVAAASMGLAAIGCSAEITTDGGNGDNSSSSGGNKVPNSSGGNTSSSGGGTSSSGTSGSAPSCFDSNSEDFWVDPSSGVAVKQGKCGANGVKDFFARLDALPEGASDEQLKTAFSTDEACSRCVWPSYAELFINDLDLGQSADAQAFVQALASAPYGGISLQQSLTQAIYSCQAATVSAADATCKHAFVGNISLAISACTGCGDTDFGRCVDYALNDADVLDLASRFGIPELTDQCIQAFNNADDSLSTHCDSPGEGATDAQIEEWQNSVIQHLCGN